MTKRVRSTGGVRPILHAAVMILAACMPTESARSLPGNQDAGFRLHYDLALHPERAELRQGFSLAFAPGTAAGAKYTFGGWRSGFTSPGSGVIAGDTGSVLVPVDVGGPTSISIGCTVRSSTWLALYLDGKKAHGARVRAGEPSVHTFSGKLARGEHVLSFGAPGGMDVHWVRVDPGMPEEPLLPPPAPASMITAHTGGAHLLTIPAGWTVGHAFEVPEGARFRTVLGGRRKHAASLTVFQDGAAPSDLGTFRPSQAGEPIDVDLGAFAGQVVRLDLRAGTADAWLVNPRIVVPGAPLWQTHEHPRNVILFLVDTLRADKLRAYNPGTRVQTPSFDRFVERAAVFERSHTGSNWTKPSVATLLSSLLPWQHRTQTHRAVLPDSIPLLQEHMQDAGYFTTGFVTNSFVSNSFGFERGWDEWVHSRETGRARAALVIDDVLGWLDERPSFQPFFLYVHTTDPHSPYAPPRELLDLYDARPYEGVVSFGKDPLLIDSIRRRGLALDARDRERLEALYDGEVTHHDEQFGRLMQGLESRGLFDETLIVFVSDHGEEFFDHGSVGHGQTLWQELVHVPIVVRWPGVTEKPIRVDDPVALVDVAPTIMDILGIPVPAGMKGHSLAPILLGRPASAARSAVCATGNSWRCLVAGRYKLLEHATSRHTTTPLLFDLEADPAERVDIARRKPLTLRFLRGLLGLQVAAAGPPALVEDAPQADIDSSTLNQLRNLGYVGSH